MMIHYSTENEPLSRGRGDFQRYDEIFSTKAILADSLDTRERLW